MEIPKYVKVGGVTYYVDEVPFVEMESDRNLLGKCDHSRQTIEVLGNLKTDRKAQVFSHELVHAMLYEAGYLEHDEDQVERMGIVLHQVLEGNKFY